MKVGDRKVIWPQKICFNEYCPVHASMKSKCENGDEYVWLRTDSSFFISLTNQSHMTDIAVHVTIYLSLAALYIFLNICELPYY